MYQQSVLERVRIAMCAFTNYTNASEGQYITQDPTIYTKHSSSSSSSLNLSWSAAAEADEEQKHKI